MAEIHVSISAENLFDIAGFDVTNAMATGTVVSLLLLSFIFYFASTKKKLSPGSGVQNLLELLIESILNFTKDVAGQTKARIFFPLIASLFVFILFNNLISILPGVGTVGFNKSHSPDSKDTSPTHALAPVVLAAETTNNDSDDHNQTSSSSDQETSSKPQTSFVPYIRPSTADVNTTLALALMSVVLTQFYGIKYQGLKYFSKFFNFSNPINGFVGILELVSEFAKIVSFAFRLFGNIFAGEVLLTVTLALVGLIAPIPFLGLEIFVAFIQALVFSMLTLVFINMATVSHDDH